MTSFAFIFQSLKLLITQKTWEFFIPLNGSGDHISYSAISREEIEEYIIARFSMLKKVHFISIRKYWRKKKWKILFFSRKLVVID